jgi:uncharacterized protein YbjT (DUF2867 family)
LATGGGEELTIRRIAMNGGLVAVLLLCGGTGDLGGRVARGFAERQVATRALVRPGTDSAGLGDLGIEVVLGDLTDPDSLRRAVDGVDTVVTTATAIGRLLAGATDVSIDAVDRVGTLSLVLAADRAGVARFVYVSMAGLTPEVARLAPLAAAKLQVEDRLRRCLMRSVVVRPDKFQEVWLSPQTGIDPSRGKAVVYGRGEVPEAYVSIDDVAELVVRLAIEPEPPALVEFGGPERLTRLQVLDLVEEVTGCRLRRRHVPRVAMSVGAHLLARPRPAIASLMGMALNADTHEGHWTDSPLRERGIQPRSTTDYVRGQLARPPA